MRDCRRLSCFLRLLATTSRTSHGSVCKTSAVADLLRWPGAEEARLFCEGDRLRDRFECTPVVTFQQRRHHGDGTGVHCAVVVQPASQPGASFAWPQGLGGMVQCDLVKKSKHKLFCFRRRPLLEIFFSRLVYRNRNLVVVVDACFTGVKRKKKDLTDERGTNYSDAIFY